VRLTAPPESAGASSAGSFSGSGSGSAGPGPADASAAAARAEAEARRAEANVLAQEIEAREAAREAEALSEGRAVSAAAAAIFARGSAAALVAARWARFGSDAETVARRIPPGCRIIAVAPASAPPRDGTADGGHCAEAARPLVRLRLPAGGVGACVGEHCLLLILGLTFQVVILMKVISSIFQSSKRSLDLSWLLISSALTVSTSLWLAQRLARRACEKADVELSADALRVARRWNDGRTSSERVRRAHAGALRLLRTDLGDGRPPEWGVEVGDERLGGGPMTQEEAEWLAAMLAAHWPELAGRAEERVLRNYPL
jgi:hypothetical protein